MPKLLKRLLSSFFITLVILSSLPAVPAIALVDSCNAAVNPHQVNAGSTNSFSVVVNNSAAQDIQWVRITRPSANFSIGGAFATGFTRTVTPADATFTNGTLVSGGAKNFILTNVQAADVQAPSANWVVEVSDNPSGANPTSCSGDLGTQIGNPDSTSPVISNISVSSITSSSAVINWTTDEPANSRVDYGTTASYGANVSSSTFGTSHNLSITGLSPSTGYHFQVTSADNSNNSAQSSDNTFVTEDASNQPAETPTNNPSLIQLPTVNPNPSDKQAPVVTVTTDLSKSFKEAPLIFGTATDNFSIFGLEYSLDGGGNWLPVDHTSGLNSKTANFDFTPQGLADGNYSILVRAFDPSGNQGQSTEKILIVDVLVPIIGPSVVAFGPLVSQADRGVVFAVSGLDEKINLQVLGGPIAVNIQASSKNQEINKIFTLNKNSNGNLWSGILAFDSPGTYDLFATAVDGAANKTVRTLNKVVVAPSSKIVDEKGKAISGAQVTTYIYDQDSLAWSVWDASAFGQKNPQTTNSNGEYDFFLPEGKYYLKITASGYHDLTTDIFEQKERQVLQTTIEMKKAISTRIGNFELKIPTIDFTHPKIVNQFKPDEALKIASKDNLTDYDFTKLSAGKVVSIDFIGKPTLVTFISTWIPNSSDQVKELQSLVGNENFNSLMIVMLESSEKFAAFQKIAGYSVDYIADPLGSLMESLNVVSLPSHLIVGRDGKIALESTKFLSKQELLEELSKL